MREYILNENLVKSSVKMNSPTENISTHCEEQHIAESSFFNGCYGVFERACYNFSLTLLFSP